MPLDDLSLRYYDQLLQKFEEMLYQTVKPDHLSIKEGYLIGILFFLEGALLAKDLWLHIALATYFFLRIQKMENESAFQIFTFRWLCIAKSLTSRFLWTFVIEVEPQDLKHEFLILGFEFVTLAIKYRLTFRKMIILTLILCFCGILLQCYTGFETIYTLLTIGIMFNMWLLYFQQVKHVKNHEQQLKEFDGEVQRIKSETQQNQQQINFIDQQTSRQEELLKKLRLLKYQQLLEKRGTVIEQQTLQKRLSTPSRILTQRNLQEEDETNSIEEIGSPIKQTSSQKRTQSRRPLRVNSIIESHEATFGYSVKDDIKYDIKYEQLTVDELDDLLKIVSGRKEHLWLPQFLRSTKNIQHSQNESQFSPEAKSFILTHFTEKEFNFRNQKNEQEDQNLYNTVMNDEILSEFENNFNYDFFQIIDINQFIRFSTFMFSKYNIQQVLSISNNEIMIEFCNRIEQLYQQNPYHNSLHAMDVTNSSSFFLENGLNVNPFEQACLIISSLAHDVGHPGLNNGYLVASQSKQALIYNDQSVLESYHASLLFHIMKDENANIIRNLSPVDYKGFRKYCLNLILDTDLQKHFPLLNKFKNFLTLGGDNLQDEQNRLLILSIAIKSADVGHGAKTLQLHKVWSRRIIEEFFLQGDLEQAIGLPVTPMCDRSQSVTKSQEGFIKAIVSPLFESFSEFLKNENFNNTCLKAISDNLKYWQQQQQEETEQDKQRCSFFRDTDYIQLPTQNQNIMLNLNW